MTGVGPTIRIWPNRWPMLPVFLSMCILLATCGPPTQTGVRPSVVTLATSPGVVQPAATAQPQVATPTVVQPTVTPTPPAATPTLLHLVATPQLPTASATSVPSTASTGPWITLAPDTGPPGTEVQITGYLPGQSDTVRSDAEVLYGEPYGTVCWAGCQEGVRGHTVPITWSATEPGHFSARFTVPMAPWLGSEGPHPLMPGNFAVSVTCLTPPVAGSFSGFSKGCSPPITSTFHLTGPTTDRCRDARCAWLRFTPAEGPPGTLIQVEGWAPLSELSGSAIAYQLAVEPSHTSLTLQGASSDGAPTGYLRQTASGDLSGAFRVPLALSSLGLTEPGQQTLALEAIREMSVDQKVDVAGTPVAGAAVVTSIHNEGSSIVNRIVQASTPFTVLPAPAWSSIVRRPLWVERSAGGKSMAVDALNPTRLAYCWRGGIRLSEDGGTRWSIVPTDAVEQATEAAGYLFASPDPGGPSCRTVTLDPDHHKSFYATFDVNEALYRGQPASYTAGLHTVDGGRTWQVVPVPEGFTAGQSGGFKVEGHTVQALFVGRPTTSVPPPSFAVEQTADGGTTWTATRLRCPSSGPCVRWGPAPYQWSAMGAATPQWLEYSTNGGTSWTPPAWPGWVEVKHREPSQLAALSPAEAVLLSSDGMVRSKDGGKTWDAVALPPLPGASDPGPLYPGLMMIPDGALLVPVWNGSAHMLVPGSNAWCAMPGATVPGMETSLQVIGDRLWRLDTTTSPVASSVPKSMPLSSLRCA